MALVVDKTASRPSVRFRDAVEHALCFGWVDSKAAGRDADSCYLIFSPRNRPAPRGAKNWERAERLTAAGQMTPAGQRVIDEARARGTWNAHAGARAVLGVVLWGQLSNSTPSPLLRALEAYRRMNLTNYLTKRIPRQAPPARAMRLTDPQLAHLVERYRAGATVYKLAADFEIDRRTVAAHLKRQDVTLHRQSPTQAQVDNMVRLYQSGLSLEAVGQRLGYDAHTVQRYLEARGVPRRDTHGRPRS